MTGRAANATGLFSHVASAGVALAVLAPIAVLVVLALGAELDLGGQVAGIVFNTVTLTLLTVFGAVLIGVPLALVTAHTDLPGRSIWLALLAAPLAIPSYIGAFAFFAAFGPGGEIQALTGLPTPPVRGLPGAALVMTLYTYPFVLLTTRASLRQLDGGMVDAARSLGLSLPAAIRRVVLPRVRSGVAAGALLVALYTLSDFATPAILRLDTFTRIIYVEYNAFGLDRAALLSLQLLALVAVVLVLESRVGTEREMPGRRMELELAPTARWSVTAGMVLVMAAALALPAAVFGVWLWREGAGNFDPILVWNSAYPATLAAVCAVLVALPVAYAASAGTLGRWLERIATLGFGIPGIVMGTALVYVGLRIDFLYQTLALLVIGYVLRFLPLAVGAIRTSVGRVEGNLLGAARSLGASRFEAFRRVGLPLILPGVIAGGALVFLEAMRELPATLLLRPTGLETLTTELWRVYEAGYFGRAAVPGLLLIGVSAVALVVMLSGEDRLGTAKSGI
ncbi:MAG: ABC transporter permease [Candidatus Wenzhouxiangella sp. M2_3B_020]